MEVTEQQIEHGDEKEIEVIGEECNNGCLKLEGSIECWDGRLQKRWKKELIVDLIHQAWWMSSTLDGNDLLNAGAPCCYGGWQKCIVAMDAT